jgi:NAD(P)-dependent dehydrogenase (short-subunit alcohol dehydrogenase family)
MLEHSSIDNLAAQLKGLPIDIVVNVAGYYGKKIVSEPGGLQEFGSSDFSEWEKTFRVNCIAPMKMTESLIESILLGDQKKVVSISSIIGSIGGNDIGKMYPYRASKAALNAVMKSMAIDLAPQNITAIALHPGWVKTDMGGPTADIGVTESIEGMVNIIDSITLNDSGKFYAYDGGELPW